MDGGVVGVGTVFTIDKCLAHSDIIANVLFNLGYTRHINYNS